MYQKPLFASCRQILVIISRLFLISTILLFALSSFGNEDSFEIKVSFYIGAPEGGLLELQENLPKLRFLDLKRSLFLEGRQVLLTQLDENSIRVDLKGPLRIGFYESQGVSNLKFDSFIISDTPINIEKIMRLRPGTLFTKESVSDSKIRRFINSLASMGFTKTMARYLETGPPMGLLRVSKVSATLNIEELIKGEVKFKNIYYLSELLIGSKFYDTGLKMLPVQFEVIKQIINESDPLIKKYLDVFNTFKSRYRLIAQRGWLEGLMPIERSEFETSGKVNFDNVVPLFGGKTCDSLFKP